MFFSKLVCSLALVAVLGIPLASQAQSPESNPSDDSLTNTFLGNSEMHSGLHFLSEQELKVNGFESESGKTPHPKADNKAQDASTSSERDASLDVPVNDVREIQNPSHHHTQSKGTSVATQKIEKRAKTIAGNVQNTGSNKYNMPPIKVRTSGVTYKRVAQQDHRRRSMASRGAHITPSPTNYKTVAVRQPMELDITPIICQCAEKHHLDPWLVRAIIQVESNFCPTAGSRAGAGGLMQLMPTTAASLGCYDRFDPKANIAAGTKYLRQMVNMFPNNMSLAIAAYNAGPGNVRRYGGIPPFAETRNYVAKVTRIWKESKARHNKRK